VTTTFTPSSGPAITTSAFEGRAVTALPDIPNASAFAYQFQKSSNNGETWSNVTGPTASTASATYTPTAGDRSYATQMYLRVVVTATISGANYTVTSSAIPVYTFPNANGGSVTAPTPASRGTYTSGRYKVGQTVIGHAWAVMGTPWPTLTYQWWVCDTSAATSNPQGNPSLCAMATGAGDSGTATRAGGTSIYDLGGYGFSYPVTSQAAGRFLTFTATLANAATTAQGSVFTFTQRRTMNSGVIQTTPVFATSPGPGTPNISGTLKVGKTHTAATLSATTINGNPTARSISYQWQRCTTTSPETCSPINGATRTTYKTTSADLNRYLRVVATARNNATTPDSTTVTSATSGLISP
jgi:hypothetical protein